MTAILLGLVVALPAVGAALTAGLRRRPEAAAAAAVSSSALTLVLAAGLVVLCRPWASPTDSASLDLPWIGALGTRAHLGLDGISTPLVLLTAALGVLCTGYLWGSGDDASPDGAPGQPPPPGLASMLLATEAASIATFLARDLLVFFIAFEAVLIPMWLLIARWGGDPSRPEQARGVRHAAATRFVLYTATGSAVLLLGLIVLATACGGTDFALVAANAPSLPVATQVVVAALLVIGLGVKVPVWPLHGWLPSAHTAAPTVGSVFLAGVLLKLGSYGLVRLVNGFVPDGLARLALPLAVLGVVGIFWGGLVCLVERDFKRLVAFSSVAHMGFVVLGVASGTAEGIQGALFVGIAHGVITSLLFWVAGMLKHRHLVEAPGRGADLLLLPAGLRDSHPRLGFALALACIASLGLPGLAGFWGEFSTLLGAWRSPDLGSAGPVLAGLGTLGTVLAAAYLLRVLYLIWQGRAPERSVAALDLTRAERLVVVPLAVATVLFGVQPWLLLSLTGPAVRALLGVR